MIRTNKPSIVELRGRDWLALPEKERKLLLDRCFQYWRRRGFPHYRLSLKQMDIEYRRVANYRAQEVAPGTLIQGSMTGLGLANAFHPAMWSVPVGRAHTPMERFQSDIHLRRLLERALRVWPNRFSVNASNLRRMLSTFSNTMRVSNFRPVAAKALYERFSRPGDVVVDFSAGYGGRLLGCMPLVRRYVGIDPCTDQVRGLRSMIETLSDVTGPIQVHAEIVQACAEDYLPKLPGGSVDLVFSSPPYHDHERYSDESSQSYRRYPDFEIWKSDFLARIVEHSARILRRRGYLLINIADVNGLQLVEKARTLATRYLRACKPLHLTLAKKPYLREESEVYKHEPILVFRKH